VPRKLLTNSEIAELVIRARRGDSHAFHPLVEAHARAAYLVALAVVARPRDAEDVMQEAFLAAFERLDTCRDPSRFSGWLMTIVRTRAIDWVQSRNRHEAPAVAGSVPGAERDQPDTGLRQLLLQAMMRLSPVQREVVLLHDLEDWTHAEIAQILDISEVMSRQHLFVARRVLRTKLAGVDLREYRHGG
jgi:RNA polymerase sigma-70 factor (ECF subfamily)